MSKTMQPKTNGNPSRIGEIAKKSLLYLFLSLWAVVVLFPFYWMILSSFKSYGAYNSEYVPKFFTTSPTLENYVQAFTAVPLAKYFLNTLIFTLFTTGLMMVVITLAAYAFARLEFKGRNLTFALFLGFLPTYMGAGTIGGFDMALVAAASVVLLLPGLHRLQGNFSGKER